MSKFSHLLEVSTDMASIPDFIIEKINKAYQLHALERHAEAVDLLNNTER